MIIDKIGSNRVKILTLLLLVVASGIAVAQAGPGQVVSETPKQLVFNGWNAEFCEVS